MRKYVAHEMELTKWDFSLVISKFISIKIYYIHNFDHKWVTVSYCFKKKSLVVPKSRK